MKVNTIPARTMIYTAILLVLVVVFVVQETTGSRRNTIPIPDLTESIDQIRIVDAEGELRFLRAGDAAVGDGGGANGDQVGDGGGANGDGSGGDAWTMGDEGHPVNPDAIAAIVDTVTGLDTVDVVTARGNDADYGLEEEDRRTLRIFTGDLEPIALQLGGSAAAGNAVYGRINGSTEIVLLPTALDTAISTDPMRYREKTMFAIDESDILEVRIASPEFETVRVQRKIDDDGAPAEDSGDTPPEGAGDAGPEGSRADAPGSDDTAAGDGGDAPGSDDAAPAGGAADDLAAGPTSDWVTDLDEEVDPARRNALIREFVSFEATGFPEYDADPDASRALFNGETVATVEVERNDGTVVTIDLWPPDDEERVPARASSREDRFFIPEWRARRLLLGLDRYLQSPQ